MYTWIDLWIHVYECTSIMPAKWETWVRRRSGQKMVAEWRHSRTLVSWMIQLQKGGERGRYVPITTLFATCNYMQTFSESSVDLLGLYMIQSLHGKRLFNDLLCEWKRPMTHPTMPCVLIDPSSITGACLTPPVLLLLFLTPMSQQWPQGWPCH